MKSLRPHELKKHRNKRRRKKLRVGEFCEFGFSVESCLKWDPTLGFEKIYRQWLAFVASNGWSFGGGLQEGALVGFVTKAKRGSLDDDDRARAESWLREREWTGALSVGPLQDAWHRPSVS